MGGMSLMHWLIVGIVIMILFGGRGRISELMGDLAKGIRSFRKGLTEEESKQLPEDKQNAQSDSKRS